MNTRKTYQTAVGRHRFAIAVLLAFVVNAACAYGLSHERTAGQRYYDAARSCSLQLASAMTIARE